MEKRLCTLMFILKKNSSKREEIETFCNHTSQFFIVAEEKVVLSQLVNDSYLEIKLTMAL